MAKATKAKDYGNFQLVGETPAYRLVLRSWGRDKCGKNHFGFTGPGPVFGQYLDPGGTEGVAEKFRRGEHGPAKEIYTIPYRFNKGKMDQDAAVEIRDQFIEDYEVALQHARTIQWDETEVWELFRWAEFGGESGVPRNYGPLNATYRNLLQQAYDAGVNLQLIQKVKEKWEDNAKGIGHPTGVFEPMGFKDANYIVQVSLEHSWDEEEGFKVKVVNCRQNMSLAGQEFVGLDFPTLGMMIFPDSSEEDWQ